MHLLFYSKYVYPSPSTARARHSCIPNNGAPAWEDNTERNPERHTYVEKYPVPSVDLAVKINCSISINHNVSDCARFSLTGTDISKQQQEKCIARTKKRLPPWW